MTTEVYCERRTSKADHRFDYKFWSPGHWLWIGVGCIRSGCESNTQRPITRLIKDRCAMAEDDEIDGDEIQIVTVTRFPGSRNSVDQGLPLSPLGMEVMNELAEVLQSWPNCYPSSTNTRSDPLAVNYAWEDHSTFLSDLLVHFEELSLNVFGSAPEIEIDEPVWEGLPLSLAYAILVSNEDDLRRRCSHSCTHNTDNLPNFSPHQHQCLICTRPRVEPTPYRPTVDMEVRSTFNCGQWVLSEFSLLPGIPMDAPRYCLPHFLSMRRMFHRLMSDDPP